MNAYFEDSDCVWFMNTFLFPKKKITTTKKYNTIFFVCYIFVSKYKKGLCTIFYFHFHTPYMVTLYVNSIRVYEYILNSMISHKGFFGDYVNLHNIVGKIKKSIEK